jgi:hypothetical protein
MMGCTEVETRAIRMHRPSIRQLIAKSINASPVP